MRRFSLWFALAAGLAGHAMAQAPSQFAPVEARARTQSPAVFALQNVRLIDGISDVATESRTIVVRDGKIAAILSAADTPPKDAVVMDATGLTALPGLMDTHVHIIDFAQGQRALEMGITTVRSMGVPKFIDVGLRQLAKDDAIAAPEMFAAGYHFYPRPPESFYTDFPQFAGVMTTQLKGRDLLKRVARAQIDRGIDWIKVNATARASQPGDNPEDPLYGEAEIAVLVKEGRRKGVDVAAHAHGDQGARDAINAGARSIEHATFLSDATLALAKEKGAYLVPTAATVKNLATSDSARIPETSRILGRRMWPALQNTVKEAKRLGVPIVAGTDIAYSANQSATVAQEVVVLAEMGLTPMDAIRAATSKAAEMLRIEKRTGRIAKNFEADLLLVAGDPLADLTTLKKPVMVISNGRIALNVRASARNGQ